MLASWNVLIGILVECLALPPLLPVLLREQLNTLFRSQPNPRQVMSPNSSQTLPQDTFHMQVPKSEADANVKTRNSPVKRKDEDASTTSMPGKGKEEFDEGRT